MELNIILFFLISEIFHFSLGYLLYFRTEGVVLRGKSLRTFGWLFLFWTSELTILVLNSFAERVLPFATSETPVLLSFLCWMALILIYQLSLPNTIILYFWVSCLSLFGRWCFIFLCTHIFLLSWKSIHFWIRTLMWSKIVTQLFRILSRQNFSHNSVIELFIIRLLTSNFPLSPLVCTLWLSKW